VTQAIAVRRRALQEKALALGPKGLSVSEKKEMLYDPGRLAQLHRQVWEISDEVLAERWGIAP
jgi:membrane glycosyltransferase